MSNIVQLSIGLELKNPKREFNIGMSSKVKNDIWILRGSDYSAWGKQTNEREIIEILKSFWHMRKGDKKITKENGIFTVSIIDENGVGEHFIIDKKKKEAIRCLTS